jgi:hypothetical protein
MIDKKNKQEPGMIGKMLMKKVQEIKEIDDEKNILIIILFQYFNQFHPLLEIIIHFINFLINYFSYILLNLYIFSTILKITTNKFINVNPNPPTNLNPLKTPLKINYQ